MSPPLLLQGGAAARRSPRRAFGCAYYVHRWLFLWATVGVTHLALPHDSRRPTAPTQNKVNSPEHLGSPEIYVVADPPVEVGRSTGSDDDLFEPFFLQLANEASGDSPRLLVAAGSPSSDGNVTRIFLGSDNATSWTEATFSGSTPLGICLPATDNGTLCLPRGAVLERDPSVSADNVYVMQSVLLSPGSNTSIVQHAPLRVDMSNTSFNMSFVVDPVSRKATNISTFHALGTVASAGGHLFLLLSGQFDVPHNVLPSGCTPKTPPSHGRADSLSTSLVLISSIDMGLHWVYRSSVPLQSTGATTSLAQEVKEEPVCSPACPKGTVCASGTDPRQCVRSVCKPKCKDCEVCDDGVCVPGEVRYVTAYPPVLIGEGMINGTDGEKLWKPQLRALTGRVGLEGPLNSTAVVVEARTGGDANASRFLSSVDGNGELWSEVLWNQSMLSDGKPGASPVCFPWGSVGQILCAGRQLHRNTSFVSQNSSASASLREERTGYVHAGSFQMDTGDSSNKGKPRNIRIHNADNISLNLSIHNITAGVQQLIGGRPVQLFDAQMLGSPATIDENGTLIQLLSVAWDVRLDTCLHTQNKLCLPKRKEEQLMPAKAGSCAMCLADHMTELVDAGCNDSDSSLFCSTPGPKYPGKSSIIAVVSTDSGETWDFRSHIPRWNGYNASAPNDGWPLGMDADPYAAWTCGLRALSADVTAAHQPAADNEPAILFAVWQPQELNRSPDPGSHSAQAPMCGARSLDGGLTWTALNQLHARRSSSGDGSNQEAPPFPAGGPVGLSTLGALGGVAISDGNCGEGRAASGRPGAGLWVWSASVLGLNATQNATPSLQATNLALLHNAHVKPSKTNELRFTSQFVNGTDHASQSSGVTDIHLLRSNKTHAELLVVYDRLPDTPDKRGIRLWNGTKTQVWALRLVVTSIQPSVLPCAPKCKAKEICVHDDPPQPWGQQGKCVAEKSCTKPKCKAPETCDKQSGHCVTPPPPPPQSCLEPESADITTVAVSTSTSTMLVAVWQPHRPSKPYQGSMCRATSHDAGQSWQFQGTINEGKNFFLSTVHSYGISPRLAYAPTSPSSGFALVVQGRSSALGAGLAIWASQVSIDDSTLTARRRGSESAADSVPIISFSDKWFNLAALHNDALISIVDTERSFTDGFVNGDVDPAEAGSGTDLHVLSSNSTHAELVVLYSKRKGLFLPNWYKHIGFPTRIQQNETILFSTRIRVSTLPPPAENNISQLEYITWYDSYPEEQLELTKPGPNLIWASGDPAALDTKAKSLGVSAMWAFNEYCEAPYRIFDAPYCGNDRVLCNPNITDSCPFGKACPQPPDKQCKIPPKKHQPHWLCECPYPAAQLALNWTQHVRAVAALLQDKTSIVGLWMGDEPEIGGMASDSLCAVAATMKQALYRVGRPDVWIMYNDGPSSARFREGLCKGLDYFSIDSYDTGAAEANEVAGLYKRALVPKLRGPNKWEPRGQGLWFVPGLYAPCTGPIVPTPRYPFGNQSLNRSEPTCKGGRLSKSPSDLIAKMEAFWKYTKEMPQIKGINPWHWQDRPTMQPDSFRRGARSLGPELLALMADISKFIHNASSTQVQAGEHLVLIH